MDNQSINALFPESYAASRQRFRENILRARLRWPRAELDAIRPAPENDETIDIIKADALEKKEQLIILTTGLHGIEGYVGAAVLQVFFERYLARFNPGNTGILLIHAINPWGMKYRRRTNAQNIDLNRNFLAEPGAFDPDINPVYRELSSLLNPQGQAPAIIFHRVAFGIKLLDAIVTLSTARITRATLLGQYRLNRGIYFGGECQQSETKTVIERIENVFPQYEKVVLLDMHTGYGPCDQMSLVNSSLEAVDSQIFADRFSYPRVVKTTAEEFYQIQGDMVDYFYDWAKREHPQVRFYGTSFEFGTLGDSILATLRSLWTMVLENQVHHFGATHERIEARSRAALNSLFAPDDLSWRKKAIADAQAALNGIFGAEGFFDVSR
jgi:hypothetical protein